MSETQCGVCGSLVAGDRKFCGNCGAPIGVRAPALVGAVEASVPPPPPLSPPAPAPPPAPPPPQYTPVAAYPPPGAGPAADQKRALLGLAVGLLVTIILVAAVVMLTRSNDSTTTNASATTVPATVAPTSAPSTAPASSAPATSVPSSTLPGGIALRPSCTSPDYGYTVKYPDGWYAEQTFAGWQCALFDPAPFTVQPDTEIPQVAVIVSVAQFSFDSSVAQYTDPSYVQLLNANDLTIRGHKAVAVEIVTLQEAMLPAGTSRYAVLVDMGDRTLVMETDSLAASDYTIDKQVVRGMAGTLTLPR